MKIEDFSLKWFGIPDKVIVEFWKKLSKLPRRKRPKYEDNT